MFENLTKIKRNCLSKMCTFLRDNFFDFDLSTRFYGTSIIYILVFKCFIRFNIYNLLLLSITIYALLVKLFLIKEHLIIHIYVFIKATKVFIYTVNTYIFFVNNIVYTNLYTQCHFNKNLSIKIYYP